jgi:hypothetical protein
VRYGKPIPVDDLQHLEQSAAAKQATERLMVEIEKLAEGL